MRILVKRHKNQFLCLFILLGLISIIYCIRYINIQHTVNTMNYNELISDNVNDISIYTNILPNILLPDTSMSNKQIIDSCFEYDISTAEKGYIVLKPLIDNTACIIRTNTSKYTYLKLPQEKIVLPLGMYNESYEFSLAIPYGDTNLYTFVICNQDIKLNLYERNKIFLMPNYIVKFSNDANYKNIAIKLKSYNDIKTMINIKNWVYENITYDKQKANKIKEEGDASGFNDYIPNLEKVYIEKKGICFDKAALATALLRLDGIPAKLVVGYYKNEYHAWVMTELYNKSIIIDPTSNFMGNSDDYKIDMIF